MQTHTSNITNLQQELLKVFSFNLDEQQLLDIKDLLANYFAKQATTEMDKLWNKKKWNNKTMGRWTQIPDGKRNK